MAVNLGADESRIQKNKRQFRAASFLFS